MADVNLPSFDLGSMMSMDPLAYQQAQNQIGLANQFAQQNLQQKQADYTASILKNLFDAQNNPQRLEAQKLANEGAGYANTEAQINARKRAKLEMWETEAAKEGYAEKTSKSQLEQRLNQLDQALIDPDPEVRNRATVLYQNTGAMLKLKSQNDARVQAAEARADSAEKIAGMRGDSAERIAAANNAAKMAAVAARAAQSKQANESFQQAATRSLREAQNATDPETRAAKQEEAQYWIQQEYNRTQQNQQGKIDINAATGMATTQAPRPGTPPMTQRPNVVPQGQGFSTNAAGNPAISAAQQNANDSDRSAIMQSELARVQAMPDYPAKAQDIAAIQRELSRLPQAAGQTARPSPAAPANNAPAAGTVVKGYRFKGGDPSKKENWIKE